MKRYAPVLAALLASACTSGPGGSAPPPGYREIEEIRVLAKGME